MLTWLEEGAVAWQGTTLDSDLTASLHNTCCLMRLRAAWQIVAGRSAIIGVGADDASDYLLLSQNTISHFHQHKGEKGPELFVASHRGS